MATPPVPLLVPVPAPVPDTTTGTTPLDHVDHEAMDVYADETALDFGCALLLRIASMRIPLSRRGA